MCTYRDDSLELAGELMIKNFFTVLVKLKIKSQVDQLLEDRLCGPDLLSHLVKSSPCLPAWLLIVPLIYSQLDTGALKA